MSSEQTYVIDVVAGGHVTVPAPKWHTLVVIPVLLALLAACLVHMQYSLVTPKPNLTGAWILIHAENMLRYEPSSLFYKLLLPYGLFEVASVLWPYGQLLWELAKVYL